MMNSKITLKENVKKLSAFLMIAMASVATAKENVGKKMSTANNQKIAANCLNTTAQTDLDIGNVRTTLLTGGDMWWDLANGKYEVPKNSGKHSMFAGSVWFGGYDGNGNLKVAGQTYRQMVNDYWAGPISTLSGTPDVSPATCAQYDRFWKVTRAEVSNFISTGTSTPDILSWPGNGNIANGELQYLAPFEDVNGDGIFNTGIDYPKYNFSPTLPTGSNCNDFIQGDQTIFWVFNDVGNIKTETTSDPIGLEVRAQAFAYSTGTNVDNCTFYQYQIINRSNISFDSTYFGTWADPDLGDYQDDFVGCDVGRGIGFCYNGDADDGGGSAAGYGLNPPAIGIDFLQGPLADANDGIDNDRDGTTDELGEQIIMSNFMTYDNVNGAPAGNPVVLDDYYQFLSGSWADGVRWTYGGSGYDPGSVDYCSFMFPGTTDPAHPTTNWSEVSSGFSVPGDRRFLQSAGAFTLLPGAVNYVTTGVIWARGNNGPQSSVDAMLALNDTVQAWFSSCFRVGSIGINAIDKNLKTTVSPNPFNLKTTIALADEINSELTLTLVDSKGKVVEELKSASSQFVINRKNKATGIYFYEIKDQQKTIASGKLVIN